MTVVSGMEPEILRVRGAASGLEEAVGLAAASLERLAGEGRDENGTGQARVAAVMASRAGVEAVLVSLTVHLDDEAVRLAQAFEVAKVWPAHARKTGLFARRVETPIRLDVLHAEVVAWLHAADSVLGAVFHLRGVLKRCYAAMETVLSGMVSRRGVALQGLEAAQKASEERRPALTEIRLRIAGAPEGVELAAEQAKREAEHSALVARETECLIAYQSLDDLTALFDVFLNTLNTQIATQNVVAAKIEADQERSVLLHAAILDFATMTGASGNGLAGLDSMADPRGRLSVLQTCVAKGFLSHAETLRRKDEADAVFTRRFGAVNEGGRTG